jgi:hypothetical protein
MKFNWGTKIALVYLLFVAGILFLVMQSSRQKIDLVTPDYYEQEIKYQERIDQSKRAEALQGKLSVNVTGEIIALTFPEDHKGKQIKGHVWVYYPADETLDLKEDFDTQDGSHQFTLPSDDKRTGMCIVKTSWTTDGLDYYMETILPPRP